MDAEFLQDRYLVIAMHIRYTFKKMIKSATHKIIHADHLTSLLNIRLKQNIQLMYKNTIKSSTFLHIFFFQFKKKSQTNLINLFELINSQLSEVIEHTLIPEPMMFANKNSPSKKLLYFLKQSILFSRYNQG